MGLDDLEGIRGGSRVCGSDRSVVEKLIEVGEEIVDECEIESRKVTKYIGNPYIYDKIKKMLEGVDFTDDDLRLWISAYSDKCHNRTKSHFFGLYSGVLLQLLTARNKERETIFYVNGNGGFFNQLFNSASDIDTVIVDNFKGSELCRSIAKYGDSSLVILMNNAGNLQACDVGGKIGVIIYVGNKGDYIFTEPEGINIALIVDHKGKDAAKNVGCVFGGVEFLLLDNVEGEKPLNNMTSSSNILNRKSKNNIIIAAYCNSRKNIERRVLYKNSGEPDANRHCADDLIVGEEAVREYSRLQRGYRTGEMLRIARGMSKMGGGRMSDIIDGARRIKEIYDSVRGLFEDGSR